MQQLVYNVGFMDFFNRSLRSFRESPKKMTRVDTLMLMSMKMSSKENIPKSLVIPSSNLKLNETVGQGVCVCVCVCVC